MNATDIQPSGVPHTNGEPASGTSLEDLIPRVVCVQNYGASGSIPLASYLDSHPGVITTPALTNIRLMGIFERLPKSSYDEFLTEFLKLRTSWFGADPKLDWGLDRLGENHDERTMIPKDRFRAHMDALLRCRVPSRRSFFVAVHVAYALALGRCVRKDPLIVYHIHAAPPGEARQVVEDFPDTRFLHTIREPVENLRSLLKYFRGLHGDVNSFECALAMVFCEREVHLANRGLGRPLFGARPYPCSQKPQTRAVLFEHLHLHKELTMRSLATWLEIDWHDSLLASTFDGKKYWNRPGTVFVSGSSPDILAAIRENNRKASPLNPLDEFRIRLLALPIRTKYGYREHWWENCLFAFAVSILFLVPFALEKDGVRRIILGERKTVWIGARWKVLGPVFPLLLLCRDFLAIRAWLFWSWVRMLCLKDRDFVDLLPVR